MGAVQRVAGGLGKPQSRLAGGLRVGSAGGFGRLRCAAELAGQLVEGAQLLWLGDERSGPLADGGQIGVPAGRGPLGGFGEVVEELLCLLRGQCPVAFGLDGVAGAGRPGPLAGAVELVGVDELAVAAVDVHGVDIPPLVDVRGGGEVAGGDQS